MAGESPPITPKTPHEQWVEDSDLLDPGFDPGTDLPQSASARTPAAAGSEPPTLPVPPKPKHSKRLVRMALDLGMTQVEIDGMETEDLDTEVYYLHRAALAQAAESRRMSGNQPAPQPATPAPEVDEFDGLLSQADGVVHEDILKLLRLQQKKIKELESLKGEVGTIRQRDAQRSTTAAANTLDESFEGLGAAYEKVVGKGSAQDMTDQQAHKRRISIIMAAGFKDMDDVASQSRAQVRAKITAAAKELFGGLITTKPIEEEEEEELPVPKKVNGRLTAEQWAAAGVARPTHRHSTEPKGVNRATKAVARLQREQVGANDDVPEGTEEASLPE